LIAEVTAEIGKGGKGERNRKPVDGRTDEAC
jgi:hypothetical protein